MSQETLANKYRPLVFSDVLGQGHIVKVLRPQVVRNEIKPAYLFAGQHGSGKCVVGPTPILTGRGIIAIEKVNPTWRRMVPDSFVDITETVSGGACPVQATKFYYGGRKNVKKILTLAGLELAGTEVHPVKTMEPSGEAWTRLGDIGLGRSLAIPIGTNLWGSAPYEKQRAIIPAWSRDAFISYLRIKYVSSLIRKPPELHLLAGSADEAKLLQLMLMNLGMAASLAYVRTDCCMKTLVVVKFQYATGLEKWISRGDSSGLDGLGFKYITDPVKSIQNDKDHVFDLSVPEGNAFVGAGFYNHNTTSARIFARALLCRQPVEGDPCNKCESCQAFFEERNPNYREVDAATSGLVDDVRRIKEDALYAPLKARYRILLMDESQRMTPPAQSALLKFIEEGNRQFVLMFATTDPEKMLPAIRSRCVAMNIVRISLALIKDRLQFICDNEGIEYDDKGLELVTSFTNGHVRDAIMLLDQIRILGAVTRDTAAEILQLDLYQAYFEILKHLKEKPEQSFKIVDGVSARVDPSKLARGLAQAAIMAYGFGQGMSLTVMSVERVECKQLYDLYGDKLLEVAERFSHPSEFNNSLLYCKLFQTRNDIALLAVVKEEMAGAGAKSTLDLMNANKERNLERRRTESGDTGKEDETLPTPAAVLEVLTWGLGNGHGPRLDSGSPKASG